MQFLDIYREKLQANLTATFDDTSQTIRFSDGAEIPGKAPLTMLRPTCKGLEASKIPSTTPNTTIDPTKVYTFASLYILLNSHLQHFNVTQYITAARRNHVNHLPWQEATATLSYLMGQIDECDLLVGAAPIVTTQSTKVSKRQKVSEWYSSDLVQLEQPINLPNSSFTLHNSPLNNNDYITMMKSIYNELHSSYLDIQTDLTGGATTSIKAKSQTGKTDKGAPDIALAGATQSRPENPIIIVPSGQTLTFSFKNLGDLFARGVYIKSNEPDDAFLIKQTTPPPNMPPEKQQLFSYFKSFDRPSQLRPGSTATFELCCDPEVLTSAQWNRVVGVVVTGKAYQLESFTPFRGKDGQSVDTPRLFENCAGVHLYFDGEKIPPTISQWNVSTHKFALSKRHQDQVVMSEVWERLIQSAKRKARTNPNLFF